MDINNINTDRDTSGLCPIEYDQTKVPELIRKHADNVRTKTYGQEVREAQARNAELAGLIASEAEDKANDADLLSKDTRNRFNDQIFGTTNSDEVIDARRPLGANNPFTTLNERLEYERKLNFQVSLNIMDMVDEPTLVDDWIPVINEAITKASELGGVSVFFPAFEYIVKPTQTNYIEIYNGINLIGGNNSVIKVADNNPDFFYLMTGKYGRLVGCTIEGLTFDTNAANQTSNVSMDNEKKRIIFRVQTASDLRFTNNKFLYSGVNAIITHGSLYGHKNNIIAHNYFKFTNQSDTTYDNTACYIGQIGHQIVNNIFESTTDDNGITARTCIETHASYGVVDGNIIKNYMSGVLVLGEDNNNAVGNMAPKIISNNIIVDCLGGVLMWSSHSDVKHVTVNGNSIYINNVTRGRYAEGFYGIALDHNSGGLSSSNKITDVNITGNNIKFEVSQEWLTNTTMPNISEYNFEGAFAIGSYTGSSRSASIKDILVSDNQITNSPRMPFAFVNMGTGMYENITIQNNGLFECITQRMLPIEHKTGLYIAGKVEYLNYIGNNFTDNRNTTYMVSEISSSKVLTGLKLIRIKNNSFLLKQGIISRAAYLPPINKGEKWEVENVKFKFYNNADSLKEETLLYGDIITLALQTDGRNTFLVTQSGTIKSASIEGDWTIAGSVLKVPENIDVRTLYSGNIIKIVKEDGTSLYESTQIIGVDYVNREVLISNTNKTYNGNCSVSYVKPATNNAVLNNKL